MNINILVFVTLICSCRCWDSDQLEVFDVVEDVKGNFYELLNIQQNASSAEIRSAFRRLSVVLHPDKNLHEDTSEKFRNLVSVYEVLKDPKKRGYYDEVLVNGLPNWKSAMYYYRRVRRMGLMEGSLIVFCIFTIGQYLVAWAAYFERIYTLNQAARTRKQKEALQEMLDALSKPSVFNTLPFQIPYFFYWLVISLPSLVILFKEILEEKKASMQKEESEEEEEEVVSEPKIKKRRAFEIPTGPTFEIKQTEHVKSDVEEIIAPPVSGGFWGDDDIEELVRLVKKHPGGTPKRWEVIAECMNRSVDEVTYMANRMKTNGYKLPSQQEEEAAAEEKVKLKTKGGKLGGNVEEGTWNGQQQKALEEALIKFPKGATDRWDRIADLVPDKTKEECMLRFKHLATQIMKKREQ